MPGPYWDNQSLDGSHRNIGYYVTGQTAYPNSPNLTNPVWLGAGNAAPSSLTFNSSGANIITLLMAATANQLEFGYFDTASPGTLIPLFTTSSAPGTQVAFQPAFATYGFYIRYLNVAGSLASEVYRSDAAASTGNEALHWPGHQHFSAFSAGPSVNAQDYVIGMEDGWGTNNRGMVGNVSVDELTGDYQDFVVRLSAVATPEPSTIMLFLAGLASLAAFKRRRG